MRQERDELNLTQLNVKLDSSLSNRTKFARGFLDALSEMLADFAREQNFRQDFQRNSIKTNQALSRCDNINIARLRETLHSVKSMKTFPWIWLEDRATHVWRSEKKKRLFLLRLPHVFSDAQIGIITNLGIVKVYASVDISKRHLPRLRSLMRAN